MFVLNMQYKTFREEKKFEQFLRNSLTANFLTASETLIQQYTNVLKQLSEFINWITHLACTVKIDSNIRQQLQDSIIIIALNS